MPAIRKAPQTETTIALSRGPTLFVCGSAAAWAKGRAAQCEARGIIIHAMPAELLVPDVPPGVIERWADRIATGLRDGKPVMAAIARTELQTQLPPARLAGRLAMAVASVVERLPVGRVCAEGGATAAAFRTEGHV